MPLLLAAGSVQAFSLELPSGAEVTKEIVEESATLAIPTGPTKDGFTPSDLANGTVTTRAIRITGFTGPNSSALMSMIAGQVLESGFKEIYACQTLSCGGFDFRFSLDLIAPPDMFVDLGDFHYFAAEKGADKLSIIVSRSQSDGYVHFVEVSPNGAAEPIATTVPVQPISREPVTDDRMATILESTGKLVLEDLVFPSGTSTLPEDNYASLGALAVYLRANPDIKVALVGHTDASGSLEANIAISKRRAQAARAKLIDQYGVPGTQVAAEGMGYLSPRMTNLTEAGRDKNRRVEVIITSTRP